MSENTFDERSVDQHLYILLDIGAKLGIWILDNSFHQIKVLSYKIFTISFVLVITKGNMKSKARRKWNVKDIKRKKKEHYLSTDGYKIPLKVSSSAMYEARL